MKKAVLAALIIALALIWAPFHLEAEYIPPQPEPKPERPTHVTIRAKPQELIRAVSVQTARPRIPMPTVAMVPTEIPLEVTPLEPDPEFNDFSDEFDESFDYGAPPQADDSILDSNTLDLERPLFLKRVQPGFPARAINLRLQGYVLLEAVLHADGSIGEIRVLRKLGDGRFGFEEEAIRALKQWTFVPGRLNGHPVSVRMSLRVDFQMSH